MLPDQAVCHCSANLPLSELTAHKRRYHSHNPGFVCRDCEFANSLMSNAIVHCLLDGHRLEGLKTPSRPMEIGSQPAVQTLPPQISAKEEDVNVSDDGIEVEEYSESPVQSGTPETLQANSEEDEPKMPQVIQAITEENDTKLPAISWKTPPRKHLTCSRCSKAINTDSMGLFSAVAQHTHTCLGMRPFACSGCGKRSTRASHIRQHIRKCPGSRLEEDQSELREGLKQCFPQVDLKLLESRRNRI